MHILLAETYHFETVKNITETTINAVYPLYYPKGAVDFFLSYHNTDNIKNDINSKYVYILFDDSDNKVGTVTVKNNEIGRLFVLPEFQGKGYGKMLLDFAEEIIFTNYEKIIISASLPAKAIYLKRGYTEKSYHTILTDNGDYLCYDEMIKPKRDN